MKSQMIRSMFLFAVLACSPVARAQITMTSGDASAINAVGNVLITHLDSLTKSLNIGSPGATSWDFTALKSQFINSFASVLPSSTPYYASDFPAANVVFRYKVILGADTADGWQYSTQKAGEYVLNGAVTRSVVTSDTMLLKAKYSPAQSAFPLPFTYNSQWGSTFTIANTYYFNGVPALATTANHTETVVVDAYGPMTLPGGAVLSALRIRRDDRYTSPTPPFYVRTIAYTFLAKSGAIVEVVARDTTAPNSGVIQTEGVSWRTTGTVSVGSPDLMPALYSLSQNYPNPFNPSTIIGYGLPVRSLVTLTVYNALGQQVGVLRNGEQDAGYHEARFDGAGMASGVYFYRLQAGTFVQTRKLILMR